ncbi:MAG: hypothetical protein ACT6TH_14515 [Brevundimonas sp.]|uniref:hypothetical protein n=1 Tax=Brevundimonas sp. TaxID=1871086 RepID=UPI004034746D
MAQAFDPRTYKPGGETLRRFHESTAFTRVLAGPIGAGKTVAAAVAEPFFAAMTQKPDSQGVRSAIVGVLRDNYRNLYATTMKTWLDWVPREFGRYVGSDDRPAVHEFEFDAPYVDGKTQGMGKCRLRVEWRALGTHSVEATCRGWELHGAFIDEADTTPVEALSYLAGRVKRGGRKETRVSRGVWAAFNKPDTDHPLYIRCVEEAPDHQVNSFEFFDQPPGVLPGGPPYVINPNAENLANLDADYYEVAARGQPEWYVRRMIRNQWGASVSGEPIFGEPDLDRLFPAEALDPYPGQELSIGMDGGGTPAAVIGGRDRYGRRVIYAEIVLTDPMDPRGRRILHGVGPKRFAQAVGDVISSARFKGCRFTIGWGDPAAFYGADREMGEYSFMELVSQHLNLPVQPAPSNELELRFEAIRTPLLRINPHTNGPDLVISRQCVWLRRGFSGDYRWAPRNPLEPSKRLKPQKTNSSHVMEAAQYWALGDQGRAAIVSGRAWDPHRPKREFGGEQWVEQSSGVWTPSRTNAPASQPGTTYSSDWSPWD